jgi:hypothetical protein
VDYLDRPGQHVKAGVPSEPWLLPPLPT